MPPDSTPAFRRKLSDAFVHSVDRSGKYADGEVPGLFLQVKTSLKAGKLAAQVPPARQGKPVCRWPLSGHWPQGSTRHRPRGATRRGQPYRPAQGEDSQAGGPIAQRGAHLRYLAEQWLNFKSAELVTKSVSGFTGALNNHVLPRIGDKPVSEIKLEHITAILTELRRQRIMAMARRVRTIIRAVLGFAEGRGWVERNVALSSIEELKIRHVVTSNPTIARPADLGRFLLRLDDRSTGAVAAAMRLLVMLPVRPGELVRMRWEDVDLVGADWRYVGSKTKHLDRSKHIVPLPEQTLVLLRELRKTRMMDDEGNGWVFDSPVYPGRPINPTSMLKSFQKIWPEYDITAHDFRATYRTMVGCITCLPTTNASCRSCATWRLPTA